MADTAASPHVVAVFNQKGGISKTTTSTNLAVGLAAFGKRVLVVDLDSQGDSTRSLGFAEEAALGVRDLLLGTVSLNEVVRPTRFENVWLLPSTYSLAGIEFDLSERQNSQRTLAAILGQHDLDCDYVVIDCPPALGILPINALAAADGVVVPVTATPYAQDGLMRTLPSINHVRSGLNKRLSVLGVLFTIHDRSLASRHIETEIRQKLARFGSPAFATAIPRDLAVIEAAAAGIPVCIHDPWSLAARAHLDFVEEFLRTTAHSQVPGPAVTRNEAVTRLTAWRRRHAPHLPDASNSQRAIRQRQSELDRLLTGDKSWFERLHLSIVHLLIRRRLALVILALLLLAGLTALGLALYEAVQEYVQHHLAGLN